MTAFPDNINFGTVTGRFGLANGSETIVSDKEMVVTFTPSVKNLRDLVSDPPVGIALISVACTISADGYLLGPDLAPGVELVATDDQDLQPTGWYWLVSFRTSNRPGPYATMKLFIEADSTIDLVTLVQ